MTSQDETANSLQQDKQGLEVPKSDTVKPNTLRILIQLATPKFATDDAANPEQDNVPMDYFSRGLMTFGPCQQLPYCVLHHPNCSGQCGPLRINSAYSTEGVWKRCACGLNDDVCNTIVHQTRSMHRPGCNSLCRLNYCSPKVCCNCGTPRCVKQNICYSHPLPSTSSTRTFQSKNICLSPRSSYPLGSVPAGLTNPQFGTNQWRVCAPKCQPEMRIQSNRLFSSFSKDTSQNCFCHKPRKIVYYPPVNGLWQTHWKDCALISAH